LLGSPGAKGQQSSAGDSEKNQYPRADKIEKRINRKIERKLNRKIKKFVVADVGGYGNKDLYQVSLETEFLFSLPPATVQSLSRWPERLFD